MSITAYKGFDKDFKCRGFQYEVGKTYEHEGEVEACSRGFHACENPFDVWIYYGPVDAKFATVELDGETDRENQGDSKIAAGKITITAEISAGDFTKKCVQWLIDLTKGEDEGGDSAQLAASGDSARLAASGDSARLAASGDSAKLAASGYSAQLAASGDSAQLAASGYSAQLAASGKKSVIASSSIRATASGALGTWISLAEFVDGECVGFAIGCIGQDGLKPDTPYRAMGGKLVEAAE